MQFPFVIVSRSRTFYGLLIWAFLALGIVLAFVSLAFNQPDEGVFRYTMLFHAFLFLTLSAHFYFRIYSVSFRVFQDRIIEERSGRLKTEIIFQHLQAIEFPPHNRRMGAFTLHSKLGKIHLGLRFNDSEKVLDLVKETRPELVSVSDYEQTRKQLVSMGTFSRLKNFWFSRENNKYILISFGPTVVAALYFLHRQTTEYSCKDLDFWAGISGGPLILIQLMHLFIENRKHFSEGSSIEVEKAAFSTVIEKVRKFAFAHAAVAVAIVIGAGVSDINMFAERTIYSGNPALKLRRGQKVWEDSRIRCLECKNPLKKGNGVFVSYIPVVLIGLPGEVVTVNRKAIDLSIHEVFGSEKRIGESEVAVQVNERGRLINLIIPLSRIGGVLRRQEPSWIEATPLIAESASSWPSTVIAEADFSQDLRNCPAGVLQATSITAAKIAQESDHLLKQKKFKEAQGFLFASEKSLTEILSQCPAATQGVLVRFNIARRNQLEWDQITIAKDTVDKLHTQAEMLFASLQRTGGPAIGLGPDRAVSGAKVPPLSQPGATLAPSQPAGTLQPTQPPQSVQPTQPMERVQPPQPFLNPKPVQASPIPPSVPANQAPAVPSAPAKKPIPDNIPPPPRVI